jgi:hypothetical protein
MDVHRIIPHVEGDIGIMEKVIRKPFFYHITFIAKADDEFVDAVRRVNLHDMPQDRLATDLDHWLWTVFGLFGEPSTKTTRKDDSFHRTTPRPLIAIYHRPEF